jgi:hypothetical protein
MPYGTINADKFTTSDNITSSGLYGFKNRIINGGMVIDQRNSGAAVTTSGLYVTDRFTQAFGNASCSFQQVSDAPSGFINSLKLTVTTGAAPSSGTNNAILQKIEGLNVADLAWGTASASSVTLSFWVKASVTGTYAVAFTNSAFNRSYVQTYVVNSANTWEYKTVTISGDTSGTWLTTNGVGLTVLWDFGSGTSLNTTAGAWQAGNFYRTSACTTIASTTNATLAITGVQLERGSTATSFDFRDYGTELSLCKRYYESMTWTQNSGSASNRPFYEWTLYFQVEKRAAPVITGNGGTFDTPSGASAPAFIAITQNSFRAYPSNSQVWASVSLTWFANAEL